MEKKKIMILGASATQVPLIEQAKKLGYETIVVSIPGNYPGFAIADKCYYLSTTDVGEIVKAAAYEQISGVVTTGTDVAVRSIGAVNTALGLTGISEKSAQLVTDKAKMKQAMAKGGVRTAEFSIVKTFEEAEAACAEIGFPVMVKCTDQAASKGISKVSGKSALFDAVQYAFSWTKNPYVIVEKCIEGFEIGIDGYVGEDAKTDRMIIPHNKLVYDNGMTDVPIGHSAPYQCPNEALAQDLIEQVEKCIAAMGLKHCFFNMDVMISDNKAFVLEIGGRTGSTCIPELLSSVCGYNFYDKMIQNAAGVSPNMDYTPQGFYAAGFITADQSGKVAEIRIPDNCCELDGVDYSFDFVPGDTIRQFKLGSDRVGQIICSARTAAGAEEKFLAAQQILREAIKYE